jgi:hypothetical protein
MRIRRLPEPEDCGGGEPYRWAVDGPGAEVEKFCRKKDARLYRKMRERAPGAIGAIMQYWEQARREGIMRHWEESRPD